MNRIIALFCVLTIAMQGQAQNLWKQVDNDLKLKRGLEREIIPEAYNTFKLDNQELDKLLKAAPLEESKNRKANEVEMNIPMPDGSIATFYIYEAPVMAPGISARYSTIKSYKGYNAADRSQNIRFDLGPFGFHGAIHTTGGQIYIDPYAKGDTDHYITYWVRDHIVDFNPDVPLCGVGGEHADIDNMQGGEQLTLRSAAGDPVTLRTYRCAIAGTVDWSTRAQRGTLERALADINTSVNRLNLIYENEAAIRLILIEDNDKIIFLDDATQPYSNPGQGRLLIGENTTRLTAILGASTFDVGHVFAICNDTGGIASLASVCTSRRANGVTCANGNNVTAWTVSITAHEFGHQFAASHSFNHCDQMNESAGTAFEPGSGSTIMSYAGLCGSALNVQNFNDDYFHVGSLDQMYNFTRNGNTGDDCNTPIETSNHAPEVFLDYESGFFIPISTPFYLEGNATDEDGDVMTYNWEQRNTGPISSLGEPLGNAPSFRSLYPSEDKGRFFPQLSDIINSIRSKNEVLPTGDKDFTFVFVARDNNPEAGTATWDEVSFKSSSSAGPFLVQYPNTFTTLTVGDQIEVTWDVANTDASPINTSHVSIDLSTDGGLTFPISLLANTPNDGAADVIIPNYVTSKAKIKISAVGNIYFDMSNRNWEIEEPSEPTFIVESPSLVSDACIPEDVVFEFTTTGFNNYNEPVDLAIVDGLPNGAVASFEPATILPGENTTLTIDMTNTAGSGNYEMLFEAKGEDGLVVLRKLKLSVTGTDFSALDLLGPLNGQTGEAQLPLFTWTEAFDAELYELEIATNPSFSESSIVFSRVTDQLEEISREILDPASIYYWRVKAFNACNENLDFGFSEIFAFSTEALACKTYESSSLPINISGSGSSSSDAEIEVTDSGILADVNILKMSGEHARSGDLIGNIISPSGKSVRLWTSKCATQQNFNLGFDDESPLNITCPISNGRTFRAEGDLSEFAGDEIQGTWILQVRDSRSGNGGRYESASIELCGSISLDPPFIVNNNELNVFNGERITIRQDVLKADDNNNTPSELTYTIVTLPAHGALTVKNEDAFVGMLFTQDDLDSERILYTNDINDISLLDEFKFTITDPDGGWVPITTFVFDVKEVTATNDLVDESKLIVYPNPVSDLMYLDISQENWYNAKMSLYTINGVNVLNKQLSRGKATINVSALDQGLYFIQLNNGASQLSKKVFIIE